VTIWKLPIVVAAIAAPIAFAFYLGGPAVGVAVGALVAVTIVAARERLRTGFRWIELSGPSAR
jgi:uncharacterized membrane protein